MVLNREHWAAILGGPLIISTWFSCETLLVRALISPNSVPGSKRALLAFFGAHPYSSCQVLVTWVCISSPEFRGAPKTT